MPYLDTHARTTGPTKNDLFQPMGRAPNLMGVYKGYVKDTKDVQKNGRLRVWIPEFGSEPENENSWIVVNYCSPFAGATNVDSISTTNVQAFNGTQTSYGMWMIPPDINNIVAVMFMNGDPVSGIWIGCLYNQYMNDMVPAVASSTQNYQFPGKYVPVAEYNKWDPAVSQPDAANHPIDQTKYQGIGSQGLINDQARGITTTSARRESPSSVFGILTPGPVIDTNATPDNIRRKGGSSFVMDDGQGTEYIQLATKSGAQIKIDESNGFVYLINRDGTSWVEMDYQGNVMIFGAQNISMRAQQDINLRADRNINIEAGQDIYIKAAKDTNTNTPQPFTYNINNTPIITNIPFYPYVGSGNGIGGNIVFQALNDVQATVQNDMYLTIGGNYNLQVTKNIDISSQNLNTTVSQEINTASQNMSLTVSQDYNLQTNNINTIAAGNILEEANTIGTTVSNELTINGSLGITQNLQVLGNTILNSGGAVSFAAPYYVNSQGGSIEAPSVTPPSTPGSPTSPTAPSPAEVKALVEKINILPAFAGSTYFKRNAQSLQTTLSTLPTYEPCPEHDQFTFTSITGYTPTTTGGQATYEGSGGAGNPQTISPDTNPDPGANNTIIPAPPANTSALSKDFNMNAYQCQLQIHEGVKYVSYNDSLGLPTGGVGHLLRDNEKLIYPVPTSITQDQVTTWFQNDAPTSIAGAMRLLTTDIWGELTDIRKRACADLCYNMGESRLSKFVNFLNYMKAGNYTAAGDALRSSRWFTQVGRRGPNIITMIVQDIDPNGCSSKFPM